MTLTQDILALHQGIDEAFILEERAGRFAVVEEAARDNAEKLSNIIDEMTESASLGLWLITGAAAQFRKTQESLGLVGILYGDLGLILTNISEDKLLAVSTETSSLGDAMILVSDQLPGLMKKSETAAKNLSAVKSVIEAGRIARDYITSVSKSSRVSINEITYHSASSRWKVRGTYLPFLVARSTHFELEMDDAEGAILSFRATSSSSLLFGLWLAALLGMTCIFGWLLYSLLTR
ncbi:MAG: hypothetical protein ABSA50_12755 [Candidatus Bathyarchaeia archaeon]|jgi:hypothetical protein